MRPTTSATFHDSHPFTKGSDFSEGTMEAAATLGRFLADTSDGFEAADLFVFEIGVTAKSFYFPRRRV
jgi:hypothetical protein